MNQVWNIFRKDSRHHWPEIAASLALLVAYAWMQPQEWQNPGGRAYGLGAIATLGLLSQLIVPLIPFSWIFLIVRAIHDESLVGDRQFWVTRPYEWKQLAAAKVLFVFTFVCVPFFIADVYLLAKAGFSPLTFFTALLWLQLIWILVVFQPVAALAAITRSIPQMLLALLLIVLFAFALGILSDAVPNASFGGYNGTVFMILIITTALAILLLQYSAGRTSRSLRVLAGLGIAILLVTVVTPYRTLMARTYPLATADQFPLRMARLPSHAPEKPATYQDMVILKLPLRLSGLPKDSFAILRGQILTLSSGQGAHWDSGWESNRMMLFPEHDSASVNFSVRTRVFDRMKSSPVQAHLLLAFTLYREKNQRQLIVPAGEFAFADYGFCSAETRGWSTLTCRIPLRSTESLLVTSEFASSTCPLGENQKPAKPGEFGREFIQGQRPVEMGISPVSARQINLYDWQNAEGVGPQAQPGICPGTPLTLSNPEVAGNARIELQFDNLSIADYQQGEYKLIAPRLK